MTPKMLAIDEKSVKFYIQAIDDIIGEAAFEGLPESKQENLYKSLESLEQLLKEKKI